MGYLAEVHSASQSCTFCNLVLAALCRNQSLSKWTDPYVYVKPTIKNGQLKNPTVSLYSYLYAKDFPNYIGIASDSEEKGPEDSSRRSCQLGIGLRRRTLNTRIRPFLDRAAVINLVSSSGKNNGIRPSFYGRIVNRIRTNMNLASRLKDLKNALTCMALTVRNRARVVTEKRSPLKIFVLLTSNTCALSCCPPGQSTWH